MSAPTPTPEQIRERLENYYDFQCEGGPLKNCVEWQQLFSLLDQRDAEIAKLEQHKCQIEEAAMQERKWSREQHSASLLRMTEERDQLQREMKQARADYAITARSLARLTEAHERLKEKSEEHQKSAFITGWREGWDAGHALSSLVPHIHDAVSAWNRMSDALLAPPEEKKEQAAPHPARGIETYVGEVTFIERAAPHPAQRTFMERNDDRTLWAGAQPGMSDPIRFTSAPASPSQNWLKKIFTESSDRKTDDLVCPTCGAGGLRVQYAMDGQLRQLVDAQGTTHVCEAK